MVSRILLFTLALHFGGLLALEPDVDDVSPPKQAPWIASQDKGLSKGSFNPWKRGITLPANARIMVIPIHDDETTKAGWMDGWQANFVRRRLKAAEREKYDLVVLEIDTHGGEGDAVEKMNKDIEKCGVPVIALVQNKALSAGALLSLGCKMIIMEPNSEIGSAKVVGGSVDIFGQFTGGDFSAAIRQKHDAYMRAMARSLCDRNGHPHAIAQGMVDSTIEVIETSDSNQRFMTDSEFETASKRGISLIKKWKLKNQILAMTAPEAVRSGLAAGIASNMDEVALGMNAPNAQITRMEISASESAARFLSSPWWRVLLVVVGLIALFIEMKSPGHGIGYASFALCMGLFFWLQIFANNAGLFELVLFGLGALLVAVELFILPTFGALGFAGISMVIVSIVLAFLPEGSAPGLLGYSGKPNEVLMRQIIDGMQWATLTLLTIIGFFTVVWWKGIALPGVSRMALNTVNSGSVHGNVKTETPRQDANVNGLNDREGVTETALRPAGKIRLDGRTYDAVSEGGFIDAGRPVRVLRSQGSALVVRQFEMKA